MKLLIVVDMQNDFVTGSLGTKEAQAIVENVENLEFIRKSLWKNIETRVFRSLKTVSRQALDQAIDHVHSFQHASEQAFFRSLWHH